VRVGLGKAPAALGGAILGARGRQAVVLVYSEFGRRVAANSNASDGTASSVFLRGSGVTGGFHGAQPSLTDLGNGDLRVDPDFPDVQGTVLDRVLGADPGAVLDGWTGQVDGLLG
jgi:uncharacterized protein (DUF1501 family)